MRWEGMEVSVRGFGRMGRSRFRCEKRIFLSDLSVELILRANYMCFQMKRKDDG